SPGSLSDGANTVSGSGTERSSPSAVVSVPAHGVASAGPPGTASARSSPPPAAGQAVALPAAGAGEGGGAGGGVLDAAGAGPAGGAPAPPPAPAPVPPPGRPARARAAAPAAASSRRSGMPVRSGASCSPSGGLSRNDVSFSSTRAGGAGAASGSCSAR